MKNIYEYLYGIILAILYVLLDGGPDIPGDFERRL